MTPRSGAPRIPPLPVAERDEEVTALLAPIQVDGGDLNIFATLVRHPRLFKRFSGFGGFLLYRGELPARDRELLILRTAWNCRAEYEWGQHARIALSVGVSQAEVDRVIDGPGSSGWSSVDDALLTAADELHHQSLISDATWALLSEHYDEHQLIELCMVVGQYHLVAFTLNSLGVEREAGVPGFP
jgi:4-carboxymuconolactone decarboxylase